MTSSTTGRVVVHDGDAHVYRLLEDGEELSRAEYRRTDGSDGPVLVFHHTFTQPQHRDHGYAAETVQGALDHVRAGGQRIVASCWFVAGFVRDHPEYADLLATGD